MSERRPTIAPIIAIDGPAGAGKSTVAKHLAAHFGLLNLETGAMYRAFALKAQRNGIGQDDAAALQALAATTSITLEPTPAGNRVLLDGIDVTGEIRNAEVTQAASRVSVHPAIRAWMVDLQREMGRKGGVVMEGRDIGTVVFPDADLKFFLDASPEARSQRRYEQAGSAAVVTPEAISRELRERDERDRNRAESPLRAAPDAVVIDSTGLTLDEVLARIEDIVSQRLATARSAAEPLPSAL
ncbi:cytidylate kinase [Silvibacterium bohemicum]|uniref:Cytidylate kinase n=1 Tax=Silvibacterium bohemicum TaxID=1577686 RepID=A0A841K439_9BACT|nr:(d)CMP kinase [Silvibacterium bohemicum]MBB6145921.1 cytidylate kinase [Silvibacterium bohemicum]